ncbi:MAG TPA: hypothetical protein VHG93_21990 [Longimicrobium sp.]|nr:hypothetical protein [Longimicrobium sp.]
MPDTRTVPEPSRLEFVAHHQPGLAPGRYEITVTQTLDAPGVRDAFSATRHFEVAGERFAFHDSDVVSVFPPAGSVGDHAHVLPHVVLRRSTLPWERQAVRPDRADAADPERLAAKRAIPWLALLVFTEGEIVPTPNVTAAALEAAAPGWPGLTLEPGQQDGDPVAVIDVSRALLAAVLPPAAELRWLAHVRRPTDDAGRLAGDEWAVVVANRLPAPRAASVAHLVALENRYEGAGSEDAWTFDEAGAAVGGTVRLVSLRSWRFSCLDDQQNLCGLLQRLDRSPAALRLPPGPAAGEAYLERGYVPLPHALRRGATTVSWYHGPLVPTRAEEAVPADLFPVRAADALLRYHEDTGMFDASFAAAWELGRLLALASTPFAAGLYGWRHGLTHFAHSGAHLAEPHLPVLSSGSGAPPLPEVVLDWMRRTALLCGIPFNYLVPDERMLPAESLRLFTLDPMWMASLLDGAFSVGRATSAHFASDALHQPQIAALVARRVSGFVMRSQVVAGWPTLQVNGYRFAFAAAEARDDSLPPSAELPLLRMERLSASVLLCLFEGDVNVIDVHESPEALHFGVQRELAGGTERVTKGLRDTEGNELELAVDPVPMRAGGVIDIAALAGQIKAKLAVSGDFTNAQFALAMIEGVTKVRFLVDVES